MQHLPPAPPALHAPVDGQAQPPGLAQPHVQSRLYEAGCDLEQAANLFVTIADQLETTYDPHGAGRTSASLARLGFDRVDSTMRKLLAAEDACAGCWRGRQAMDAIIRQTAEK